MLAGPPEAYAPEHRTCFVAFHEAVGQLQTVYAQLRVAEGHIELMRMRDAALVDRTREAEKMANEARADAKKREAQARKSDTHLKRTTSAPNLPSMARSLPRDAYRM